MNDKKLSINDLPNEIITNIFSYVDIKSLYLINILTKGYYENIMVNLKFSKIIFFSLSSQSA